MEKPLKSTSIKNDLSNSKISPSKKETASVL